MGPGIDARLLQPALSGALVVAYVFAASALVVYLAWRLLRHVGEARRLRSHEARAATGAARSDEGPALLEGHAVRVDRSDALATTPALVALSIEQRGAQSALRPRPTMRWREHARRVEAQPFVLELSSGTTVLVDPRGAPVTLWCDEYEHHVAGVTRRTLVAKVEHGQALWVDGWLTPPRGAQGPRASADAPDGASRATVSGTASRGLVLSFERPSRWHARQARATLIELTAVVAIVAGVYALALRDYVALLAHGRAVEATFVEARTVAAPSIGFDEYGRHGVPRLLCAGVYELDPRENDPDFFSRIATPIALPVDLMACAAGRVTEPSSVPQTLRVAPGSVARPGRYGTLRRTEFLVAFASVFVTALLLLELERRRRLASGERLDPHEPMLSG